MKYSCCRSVTSNVLINFQLVTLIESNVYCLVSAGGAHGQTELQRGPYSLVFTCVIGKGQKASRRSRKCIRSELVSGCVFPTFDGTVEHFAVF